MGGFVPTLPMGQRRLIVSRRISRTYPFLDYARAMSLNATVRQFYRLAIEDDREKKCSAGRARDAS